MTTDTVTEPWIPADVWATVTELARTDRCDRCSAEARVRLRKDGTNLVLDMCRHHFLHHALALAVGGWRTVHDTLAELEQRPGASA